MNTSNFKDTATTIAGIVFTVCTSLVTANASGVVLPHGIVAAAGILVAISGGLIGWLTGKAPSGATKTDSQVSSQNVK